jgi:hypothetical protein
MSSRLFDYTISSSVCHVFFAPLRIEAGDLSCEIGHYFGQKVEKDCLKHMDS